MYMQFSQRSGKVPLSFRFDILLAEKQHLMFQ